MIRFIDFDDKKDWPEGQSFFLYYPHVTGVMLGMLVIMESKIWNKRIVTQYN